MWNIFLFFLALYGQADTVIQIWSWFLVFLISGDLKWVIYLDTMLIKSEKSWSSFKVYKHFVIVRVQAFQLARVESFKKYSTIKLKNSALIKNIAEKQSTLGISSNKSWK